MRLPIHLFLALVAGISGSSARELTLTLGGDEYQGPPEYEVVADDVVVGSGVVTAKSGQMVTLEIGNPKTLAIRFTNDLAGPKGAAGVRPSGTDRNLIIEKIEIDGTDLPLSDIPTARGLLLGADRLVVANSQSVPVPLDGLPAVAGATPTEPVAEPVAEAPAAETRAVAVEPAAEPTIEEAAPVAKEPAVAEAAPSPVCTAPAVDISGYANGVVDPPAEALKVLLATTIPAGCLITITGYSSSSGAADLNMSLADQRASAVHDKLVGAGVDPADMEVVAFGATKQFGPVQADNRRVVVSFQPKSE